MLKLKPNEKVLDVGCGIGGGDFLMSEKHDVFVHGIDLSVNMVLIALERASLTKRSKVFIPRKCKHKDPLTLARLRKLRITSYCKTALRCKPICDFFTVLIIQI